MLFNSYAFILLFLPITFLVYFGLNKIRLTLASKAWLVFASIFFYGYWNPVYVPLMLGSITFNYIIGALILKKKGAGSLPRIILAAGIAGNLILLGYFKYMDFFITNINLITSMNLRLLHIALPLGISFFTFTQIAFLVDTARGTAKEYSFLNYMFFVTFFPHLLAGPIIHHKEMMPQFDRLRNKIINHKHIAQGLTLFFIGLFKKVVIADTLVPFTNISFDHTTTLTLIEAWTTGLCYTLQLYSDFSGYTDMALGASLLFNIRLPINFNNPLRSIDIQDFWRRWHMTLGRFVRDYLYIPLGGNKVSEPHLLFNALFIAFAIGIWHGAGWTFAAWGLLHGCSLVVFRIWQKQPFRLPNFFAWLITFTLNIFGGIFFRAKSFADIIKYVKAMFGMTGIILPEKLSHYLAPFKLQGVKFGKVFPAINADEHLIYKLAAFFIILMFYKTSNEFVDDLKPNYRTAIFVSLLAMYAILHLQNATEFIYFNF